MIKVRNYVENDAEALWQLLYNTVRVVNLQDYTQSQVQAWAPDICDLEIWHKKMKANMPFVAEKDGVIVGFADLQSDGLIDHFFCHHEYQGCGVGKVLMNQIFNTAKAKGFTRLYSKVSITAKPFYEYFGFEVLREQTVEIQGEKLTNYIMEKFN